VPNNDDLINDILNELDQNNKSQNSSKLNDSIQEEQYQTQIDPDETIDDSKTEHYRYPENVDLSGNYNRSANEPEAAQQNEVKIRRAPDSPARHQNISEDNSSNKKKKKRKKKRSRLPGVLILTTFIFAVSVCMSLVIIAYGKDMLGIGKSDTTHIITIPENATTDDIAAMLEADGIIKSPEFFKLFSRLSKSDAKYIPGDHFIRPNMAYETIIQELTSIENEQKNSVQITFPEGITLYDAAVILEENGVCSIDDFLFYFNAGDMGFEFEDKLPPRSSLRFYQMEGFAFPDTYFFYEQMDPKLVCQKIYANFNSKMTEERYRKMEKLNLDIDQLITFASIVQKEAATKESMTLVASVFWNRLNSPDRFPKLESDPTKNYAENVIKPHMDVYDQIIIDSYNTYVGTGLPPGPICNPGTEAIDAVLEAFESEYYYFIANINTGQTYFSSTLEEHEEYQRLIQEQLDNPDSPENSTSTDQDNNDQEGDDNYE